MVIRPNLRVSFCVDGIYDSAGRPIAAGPRSSAAARRPCDPTRHPAGRRPRGKNVSPGANERPPSVRSDATPGRKEARGKNVSPGANERRSGGAFRGYRCPLSERPGSETETNRGGRTADRRHNPIRTGDPRPRARRHCPLPPTVCPALLFGQCPGWCPNTHYRALIVETASAPPLGATALWGGLASVFTGTAAQRLRRLGFGPPTGVL